MSLEQILLEEQAAAHKRSAFLQVLTIVVTVISIVWVVQFGVRFYRHTIPASAWYEIPLLEVPDHEVGENAEMRFSQIVKERFVGQWTIQYVRRASAGGVVVCSNSGTATFEPSDTVTDVGLTVEEFIERRCLLRPGRYRFRGRMEMKRPGWPEKHFEVTSNVFRVEVADDE